jgi:hypothetical protein
VRKKEVVVSEDERFKTFLKEKKPYGLLIIPAGLLSDSVPGNKLFKALASRLHTARLGSFFRPMSGLKIKHLSSFIGKKKLSKKDLSRYIEEDLLSYGHVHGLDAPFSLYTAMYRLPLIKKCQRVLKYNLSKIKQIVAFDNLMIGEFNRLRAGILEGKPVFLFPDLWGPPVVFLRKTLQWLYEFRTLLNQMGPIITVNPQFSIPRSTKEEPGDIDLAEYLAALDYEKATMKEKNFVTLVALVLWIRHEMWKMSYVTWFHEVILSGYSPQVFLEGIKRENSATAKLTGKIDWEKTLNYTKALTLLSFLRTPDFEVELTEGKITVQIFEPKKVDATVMRKIEKVYNIFRQRLSPTRKRWGEKTGIREEKKRCINSFKKSSKR